MDVEAYIPVLNDPNAQSTVPCDDCESTEDVFSYCVDCPGALCEKCKEGHQRRKMTRSHKVVDYTDPIVENSKKVAALGKCEKHPGNPMVSYCEKCRIPCCFHCLASDHRDHKATEIIQKYNDAKANIEKYIQTNKSESKRLSDDISATEGYIELEITNATKLEEQLKSIIKGINEAVAEEESKVRARINAHKEENIAFLRRHIHNRQMQKFQYDTFVTKGNQLLKTDFNTIIKFERGRPLRPILYTNVSKSLSSMSINQSQIDTQSLAKMIGELQISKPSHY